MTKRITPVARAKMAAEALDAAIVVLHERTEAYINACTAANAYRLTLRLRPVREQEAPAVRQRIRALVLDDRGFADTLGLPVPAAAGCPLAEAHERQD